MRIWDLEPRLLCNKHLLGEHRELHGLWNILTQGKKGYSRHPETLRWVGKTRALEKRHEALVEEMFARGMNHKSPLTGHLWLESDTQDAFLHTTAEQIEILRRKPCECFKNAVI